MKRKSKFNPNKLGAGMLAAAPILINFTNLHIAWYVGFGFAVVGPILIAKS